MCFFVFFLGLIKAHSVFARDSIPEERLSIIPGAAFVIISFNEFY